MSLKALERGNPMQDRINMFDFNGGKVRAIMIDDTPWFVGKDVAAILGYKDLNRAVNQHVDREDRKSLSRKAWGDSVPFWESENDWANKVLINEPGVYNLIFGSKLSSAREFKHWVTSEVLPSIRKSGIYEKDQVLERMIADPDYAIELLTELKREQNEL